MSNHRLASTSFIYLIFSVMSQLFNMLLIPLYTRNLTIDQFGQYSLINSVQCLLSIFITLGVFSGLRRFYNEYEDKNGLKNIALIFSVIWGSACIVLGTVSSPLVGPLLFNGDILCSKYVVYIIVNSVLTCLMSTYTSYYAMQFKAIKTGIIELLKIILTIIVTYYLLCMRKSGILGILKAQTTSYAFITMSLIILDIKNIKINRFRKGLSNMLKYGIGLIPGEVSTWVLNLIDRYFIKSMLSLSAVGIYTMSYKIGMLISPVFIEPFSNAFTPVKYSIYNKKDGMVKIRTAFKYYNFIGWFCILGLSLFSRAAINILSTSEYEGGWKIVPVIVFSYFIWGMGNFYTLGLHLANKTIIVSLITGAAALMNIILNIVLIPVTGIYGAALSTVISYVVSNIIYFYTGRKYYNLKVNILDPYKYGVIFISLYGIYYLFKIYTNSLILELLVSMILCFAYLVICLKTDLVLYSTLKSHISGLINKNFLYQLFYPNKFFAVFSIKTKIVDKGRD